MLNENQEYGKKGEDMAAGYLEKKGYEIIEKNYSTKLGEIDIIAKDKDCLVFVEVKARKSLKFGPPEASVTYRKQKKLSQVALFYLKKTNQLNKKARFDVVSVISDVLNKKIKFKIIKNAFNASYR